MAHIGPDRAGILRLGGEIVRLALFMALSKLHRMHPGHLYASGAAGVPGAPPWLTALIAVVALVAAGLYWASTRI